MAKTWPIRSAAALAGYFDSQTRGPVQFVIILNGLDGYLNPGKEDRYAIAEILKKNL